MAKEKIKPKLNPDIIKYLDENGMNNEETLLYCLAEYFDITTTSAMFPHLGTLMMNVSKDCIENILILEENDAEKIKLLDIWVKLNYMPLFKEATSSTTNVKRHSQIEVTKRLQRLFYLHPDITKEEVLKAAKLHISETPPDYVLTAQYFISKGVGLDRSEPVLDYIERIREMESQTEKRNSITNTIQ